MGLNRSYEKTTYKRSCAKNLLRITDMKVTEL